MSLLLVGLGFVALVLPGIRPSLSLRGNPRWFAPLDAMALGVGGAAVVAGLGLSAAIGVVHIVTGAPLARYEGHLAPGGVVASFASLVVLVLVTRQFARALRRRQYVTATARAEIWVGRHHTFTDHEVVVLPTAEMVAYSVEGMPPQVVVSEGLEARVGSEVVRFVVEHERAHLRRHDRRLLLVSAMVDAAFGLVPIVRRGTLALLMAVERSADEDAAGVDQHRRLRLAAGMRHLASVGPRSIPPESVAYRAAALGSSPPRTSGLEFLAAGGLAAVALGLAGAGFHIGMDIPPVMAALP